MKFSKFPQHWILDVVTFSSNLGEIKIVEYYCKVSFVFSKPVSNHTLTQNISSYFNLFLTKPTKNLMETNWGGFKKKTKNKNADILYISISNEIK